MKFHENLRKKRRTPSSEGQKEYLQSKDDRVKLDGMCAGAQIPESLRLQASPVSWLETSEVNCLETQF